jgi:hypothetical protein
VLIGRIGSEIDLDKVAVAGLAKPGAYRAADTCRVDEHGMDLAAVDAFP